MIGQTISHYKITRQLGAGGMGVVYEAVDTKLDRTVALKFLPPESTRDPDAKARFVHEAKAASALDHNNVCVIHEIDETDDGQLFLAMACYRGETLKDRISAGPLPLNEALDITRQVAEGLAKAHEGDIVHRDIKPANIFLTEDGVAKILDFGLAKLEGQTLLTKTGTTLGTAGYMSPEQARGDASDQRTDLWCLGVVLYQMVSGRMPFPGDQQQAIVYGILNLDPDPVTGLRTGVPMELERIIGKCLAKDPKERYQSAEELLADQLRLRREMAPDSTVTMQTQGVKAKRRPWPWMIGSLFAVVLVVALGIQHFNSESDDSPVQEMRLAVLPFENLGNPEDEYFSDGISDEISVRLTNVEGLRVLARTSTRYYKNPDQPIPEIGKELGVDYILVGTIRWQKQSDGSSNVSISPKLLRASDGTLLWADAYRDLTHRNLFPTAAYGSAYWYAEESEKYYRHILDELEPHNAYAAVNLGYLSLIRARGVTMTNDKDLFLSTAYAKFNDADSMRKGFAAAHIYMAEYYVMRKDYGKAIDKYEDLQRSGIEDAYIHAWWGYALKKSGRPAEARKHFMKAVEAGDPEASAAWSRKQI